MKTLRELFKQYTPSEEIGAFFDSVKEYQVRKSKKRADFFEIDLPLDRTVSKTLLYEAEDDIRRAYDGKYLVRFVPKYPSKLFSYDYIPQIIVETEKIGEITKGFFIGCDYTLKSDCLEFSIPFNSNGVDFLTAGKVQRIIEEIIYNEFSIKMAVVIKEMDDYIPYFESEEHKQFIEELNNQCRESLKEYENHSRNEASGKNDKSESKSEKEEKAAPEIQLSRIWSAYDEDCMAIVEDGICTIGRSVFDISCPELKWGDEEFAVNPVSISTIRHPGGEVCVIGTVSGCILEQAKFGNRKWYFAFGIFDGNASIHVKIEGDDEEECKGLADAVSNGMCIAVCGTVKKDYKSGDLLIVPDAVSSISKQKRKDTAPQKRVELHLHTNMSAMDALIPSDVAVKTAAGWGHKAVAITDHGNAQGFPEAMIALDKMYNFTKPEEGEERFKVIYGLEAYFVNDSASPLYGKYNGRVDDNLVIFDLETTGLSSATCEIIEIGAVKVANGEIVDRYSTFVKPESKISEEITKLTSITNDDVSDARKIDEVLPEFLEFCGKALLVAHNADFDVGFVRAAANKLGIKFDSPYLDTVGLSRFLNTDLKSHKLDVLAKYFNLGGFNHHRAVDDAEMLTMIYFSMVKKMQQFDIQEFAALIKDIQINADPLKLKTYHMIILVKNLVGLKNLYRLISMGYLNYYHRSPRIPKSQLDKYREGLIIGSACSAGELYSAILDNRSETEIEEIASYYDYLEVQPIGNDKYLIADGEVADEEALRNINRRIVSLGDKLGKPVVATSDAHFINPEDELYRRILLAGLKFKDADKPTPIYMRTTDEMLEEFAYLGEEKAFEIVVKNSNDIADSIEQIRPIPAGSYPPHLEGAEEELREKCWTRARSMYSENLPDLVKNRLEIELNSIISNGYAVLYVIAERLVHYSESQGYLVGSRGSVGSSFVATMAGISEVNPLPPHYYCKKCQYNDFSNPTGAGSGFDMPSKNCPVCGTPLEQDGQDIPFETFLGFKGDKSPDIDLNFSGEVQGKVHKFTEELFGAENVFKAGTIGTLADKTAFGFVMKYFEGKGQQLCRAEVDRIINGCVGVKRTTGQHPGGIIVVPRDRDVYDFTPVQHPADDPKSDIVTTHFAFSYLHDTILKLDELGHDIPTKYKYLEKYSGIMIDQVAMNDRSIYELFESTEPLGIPQKERDKHETKMLGLMVGTLGLPEFGTNFIQGVLVDAKPKNFADLMQISGLTHGTDVWLGNAQDLIKDGICDISKVIGTRDGIMLDLIRYGMENLTAFKIMESVRKGKGLTPEWEADMLAHNVPEWYIASCKKIKYMFPKAHAAAYVMSAIRLAWYKVHEPVAFYCAILSVAPDGFDGTIVAQGRDAVYRKMLEIDKMGKEATAKDKDTFGALQFAHEAMLRGVRFLPVSLKYSDAREFLPENGNIRMPMIALPGLGLNAALSITAARDEEPFFSVEDLKLRGKANKGVIDTLRANGVLDGLSETDQISLFDII